MSTSLKLTPILPPAICAIPMPVTVIRFPVGGMPNNAALCVPTVVHRTAWLIVSIEVKFGAVSKAVCCEIDRNALTATFLTLLDRSFTTCRTGGQGTVVAGRAAATSGPGVWCP